jgi:hypothetical protein
VHSELRNFGQYVRSLYRHGAAVVGSFALTILLWAMDKWNPPWWETLLLFGVGFMITQYLAWRDVWLKMGESQQLKEAQRERDVARGKRDEARGERDEARGERDEARGERDAQVPD